MRTTVTLDDDVVAAIEAERAVGESFRDALNRLVRRGLQPARRFAEAGPLPILRGAPRVDVTDVSEVLGRMDDERVLDRGGP